MSLLGSAKSPVLDTSLSHEEQEQSQRLSQVAIREHLLDVSRNEARHLALRPHLESLSNAARDLGRKALPHVEAFSRAAQGFREEAAGWAQGGPSKAAPSRSLEGGPPLHRSFDAPSTEAPERSRNARQLRRHGD